MTFAVRTRTGRIVRLWFALRKPLDPKFLKHVHRI